ncbi:uncharacterized protein LOC133814908 [Humulus lupulus]|uniref:uncharacterized protein LOC133814908 n=1 Tax=Humulus lupulus TaxID=3486 RepID=UPI002B40A20E|nr:uncharacterized protein LOC133814908 [Humulus lupulus]
MDRRTFAILCHHLRTIEGLKGTKNMDVEEMVAMFLYIVSHDIKNRIMRRQFACSGETISRQFNAVLNVLLCLHELLLRKPEPILGSSTDERWKWFKNCLAALDGTYIKVNVSALDRPRYRTRKSEIATNVLGVVSQDMQFIYVLPGWEGSAADSRVLRDAISRTNGLKVPQARNVVERAFGLLKGRWAILRGRSYYPVKIQCRIILACCLLHNLIRREMPIDPLEQAIGESEEDNCDEDESVGNDHYTH